MSPLPRSWRERYKSGLLFAVGLARMALAEVRAGFDSSPDPRAQLASEVDRLRAALALRDEECRILRARVAAIPARERPHYPAAERFAILELRTRSGWNAAETARRFLLTRPTIASWMSRLDEDGPQALVQTKEPVNRYPDFVAALAKKLHGAAPAMGRRTLAAVLGQLGLVLAASTVARLLERAARPKPPARPRQPAQAPPSSSEQRVARVVRARYPHHVWHIDLTVVPILGLWLPWLPFTLPNVWPFAWHVAFVLDHFSRAVVAFEVYRKEPTAGQICALLDRAVLVAGRAPRHIVSDRGTQFQDDYRAWCRRAGARIRSRGSTPRGVAE